MFCLEITAIAEEVDVVIGLHRLLARIHHQELAVDIHHQQGEVHFQSQQAVAEDCGADQVRPILTVRATNKYIFLQ